MSESPRGAARPGDVCREALCLARSTSGMRTSSRYADDDFAKMCSRGHVPVGRLRLIEGEYFIEHRLNAARRYRTAHCLKHLHRADGDALHVGATGKDQSRIEFSGSY